MAIRREDMKQGSEQDLTDRLAATVASTSALQNKLTLLIGSGRSGKTAAIRKLALRVDATVLNVGAELSVRLKALPQKRRALAAITELGELADQHAKGDLVLMDNLELLFDRSLKLDPLDVLRRHAHARRVVAVWPGELRDGRLVYAETGHPEYRDYGLNGLVPFEI